MTTPSNNPEHIPQSLENHAGALVEHVYAEPGTLNQPDLESQDRMGEYLMERFEPEERFTSRIVLAETGRKFPALTRQIVGHKEGYSYEWNGWLFPPRLAVAAMVGITAISVAKPALLDASDEAKQIGHDIYRVFEPVVDTEVEITREVPIVGPIRHIRVNAEAGNMSGSTAVDTDSVQKFQDKVARVVMKGGKLLSVTVTGKSSDDYGTNESIGRAEPLDQDYADERAAVYAALLSKPGALNKKDLDIVTRVDQNVLSPTEKRRVSNAATEAGFTGTNNIIDAINAVNAGEQTSQELRQLITELFTNKRGVVLDAAIDMPGKQSIDVVTDIETIPGVDNAPNDPNRDYDPIFLPIPPIPRRPRRILDRLKPVKRWAIVPGARIMTPTIITEEKEQTWLRIRPEAIKSDGTLIENSWAYTRKYEYLLRDNRIADVLRADYSDKEGIQKSLRIMFVDISPAKETIDAFSELLKSFAAMENGKIADRVSGIFVYPSETAGVRQRDPKLVNMGIDKQSSANILGTYTYALDLVELHMPATWNAEELEELFHEFGGPRWVLAHEVGGHATDDSDMPLRLRRVHGSGIANAHIITGEPRAQKMKPLQKSLRDLAGRFSRTTSPVEFDITYSVPDNKGQLVQMNARVAEGDPRLAHANSATIVGYKPTQYAAANVSEHYAETAAAVITADAIPYDEADVRVPTLQTSEGRQAEFALGYHPDVVAQRLFTDAVGAQAGNMPLAFADTPTVEIRHVAPANDPLLRQEMIRTRRLRTLLPQEMVAILARVTQRNQNKA